MFDADVFDVGVAIHMSRSLSSVPLFLFLAGCSRE